jgi:hypothetical protein
MYIEYCNYNKIIESYDDELQHIFQGVDKGLTGVATTSQALRDIGSFMPSEVKLAVPLDYPLGYATAKTREHMAIEGFKSGANFIDYVPNSMFIKHNMSAIYEEIDTLQRICQDYGGEIRAFLDYHRNYDTIKFASNLSKHGVKIFFPTLSYHYDNPYDNLITAKTIEATEEGRAIFNGFINKQDHFDMAKKSQIYGIRLYNLSVLIK